MLAGPGTGPLIMRIKIIRVGVKILSRLPFANMPPPQHDNAKHKHSHSCRVWRSGGTWYVVKL